jgi:hypothetical protein
MLPFPTLTSCADRDRINVAFRQRRNRKLETVRPPQEPAYAVKHLSDAELDLMHAAMSLAILEQQYSH